MHHIIQYTNIKLEAVVAISTPFTTKHSLAYGSLHEDSNYITFIFSLQMDLVKTRRASRGVTPRLVPRPFHLRD